MSEDLGSSDIIIAKDLCEKLGLDILFSDKILVWDGAKFSKKAGDSDMTSYFVEES